MGHQAIKNLKNYLGDSNGQPGFRSLIKTYPDLMPVLEEVGDTHGCKYHAWNRYEMVFEPYHVDIR